MASRPITPISRTTRLGLISQPSRRNSAVSRGLPYTGCRRCSSSIRLTGLVFRADETCYVNTNQTVNLYGITVLEAAVLKFAGGAKIVLYGPVDCRTGPYHPATLTAKDDNSIGHVLTNSAGVASGWYGTMLVLADTATTYDLHDLRFFHAYRGLEINTFVKANLSHLQIGKSRSALGQFAASVVTCRNFLFFDLPYPAILMSGAVTNRSEHGTLHRVSAYRQNTNSGLFTLTNSLLISVTNNVVFTGANNVVSLNDAGFFQTAGAGAHYLAAGSTNRGAGTTNVPPLDCFGHSESLRGLTKLCGIAVRMNTNQTRDSREARPGSVLDP
jgi:hypothetical protein